MSDSPDPIGPEHGSTRKCDQAAAHERDDLRREMEGHLSMLEEDARRAGASGSAATRSAEDRFGDAVTHFRQSLATMDQRQAHLRNAVIALAFGALLVTAVGIVVNLLVLGDLRSTVEAWSARANPVEADFTNARFHAVLLEASWATPLGEVTRDIPILRTVWDEVVAGVAPGCPHGQWPALAITLPDAPHIQDVFGAPPGTRVTLSPRRSFQMRAYSEISLLPYSTLIQECCRGASRVDCVTLPNGD